MGLFSKRDPDGPPDYGSLGGKGATGVPQPMLTGWACMTLSSDDRIRLINFPPSMTDIVRQTIVGAWPKGIDKEKDLAEHGAGVWEFKMKGYPCELTDLLEKLTEQGRVKALRPFRPSGS